MKRTGSRSLEGEESKKARLEAEAEEKRLVAEAAELAATRGHSKARGGTCSRRVGEGTGGAGQSKPGVVRLAFSRASRPKRIAGFRFYE